MKNVHEHLDTIRHKPPLYRQYWPFAVIFFLVPFGGIIAIIVLLTGNVYRRNDNKYVAISKKETILLMFVVIFLQFYFIFLNPLISSEEMVNESKKDTQSQHAQLQQLELPNISVNDETTLDRIRNDKSYVEQRRSQIDALKTSLFPITSDNVNYIFFAPDTFTVDEFEADQNSEQNIIVASDPSRIEESSLIEVTARSLGVAEDLDFSTAEAVESSLQSFIDRHREDLYMNYIGEFSELGTVVVQSEDVRLLDKAIAYRGVIEELEGEYSYIEGRTYFNKETKEVVLFNVSTHPAIAEEIEAGIREISKSFIFKAPKS